MITRVLPLDEWPKLLGTDTASIFGLFGPDTIQIVVLEDGDRIVGACAVLTLSHIEGLWIDPSVQGVKALTQIIEATWSHTQGPVIATSALDDRTAECWERFGAKEWPAKMFLFSRQEPRVCRHWQH